MKYLLPLFFIAPISHAQSLQQSFTDKQELHFLGGYALDATIVQMLPKSRYRLLTSGLITLGLGVLKECFDTKFSREDVKVDAIGIGAYSLVHLTFKF